MHSLNQLLDAGVQVLTSSRRLAHALRISYGAHAQASGRSAWRTPTILPLRTWLRAEWLEARARSNHARALSLLSAAQSRVLWEQIVQASSVGGALLNPREAARTVARSYELAREYLIDPQAIAGFETPEAQALAEWSAAFQQSCQRLEAIDESALLAWAWDTQFVPETAVVLVGFDHLPPAISRLVQHWDDHRRVTTLPAAVPATRVRVVGLYDREQEIEVAARWARQQVESGVTRVAVLLDDLQKRQAEIQRAFDAVFAPAHRALTNDVTYPPFVIAASQPLSNYPLVDAAVAVLELVRGDADSVLAGRLLRSPFVRGAHGERDARALADAALRRAQRDRWDAGELERWAGVSGCTQLELAARDLTRVRRELPARALPSAWSMEVHALLQAIGWPGERPLISVEQQTLIKFQAVTAELARLDGLLGPITFVQALRELQRLVADTLFEPETPPALVTIIDPFTVAGMSFQAAWVAGLDAAHLPAPAAPDPFIPLPLQRAAGIPESTAESSFAHSQRRLGRILTSTANLVMSWPRHEGDAELQMSPLLATFPAIAAENLELAAIQDIGTTIFAARPRMEVTEDDQVAPLAARTARGGARILELQSLCPFRAQATLRLHAEPLARVAPGLQASDRGRLLHQVLDALWKELRTQQMLLDHTDAEVAARLRALATRFATRIFVASSPPRARMVELEVDALVRQLSELLAIDRIRPPFRVVAAEDDEPWNVGGLQVRIKPDRIDEIAGGQVLIDYKLGDSHAPREWLDRRPGRPPQPQLPLYATAHAPRLAGLAFATLAPGSVEYRGWSNGASIAPGVKTYPDELKQRQSVPPDWNSLLQHWQKTLDRLASSFISGAAAVDPLPGACDYCHLSTFCRIHEAAPVDEAAEGDVDG